MTLKLKHLAPYLPYGLPVWHLNKIKKLSTGTGTSNNWVGIQTCIRLTNMHGECMPMMRPLSDLTKEIEHNGEKFVPIQKIFELVVGINYFDQDIYDLFDIREPTAGYYLCYELNRHIGVSIDTNDDCNIRIFDDDQSLREIKRQYYSFQKLHEWYFDVFGLIDQGLAKPIEK